MLDQKDRRLGRREMGAGEGPHSRKNLETGLFLLASWAVLMEEITRLPLSCPAPLPPRTHQEPQPP